VAGQKSSTARGPAPASPSQSLHGTLGRASPSPHCPRRTLLTSARGPGRYPHRRAHRAPSLPRPHKQPTAPRPDTHTHERSARSLQAEEGSPLREGSEARWPVLGRGKRGGLGSAAASADSVGGSRRCAARGADGPDRPAPRRPRRRPSAGAGTPRPRRGGAGICPARWPGTCNGVAFSPLLLSCSTGRCGGLASVVAPCTWVSEPRAGSG
jgi:hypothetical protein